MSKSIKSYNSSSKQSSHKKPINDQELKVKLKEILFSIQE